MEKWDRENYLLDMPDVSSGASHIAPGETTKRGREVHWIIILSPLPRHTNFQCCWCCYCWKCLQHINYLGENTLSSCRKWKVVSVDSPGVNLNNYSISRKHPYFTNELVLYQVQCDVPKRDVNMFRAVVRTFERLSQAFFFIPHQTWLLTPHFCLKPSATPWMPLNRDHREESNKCSLKFLPRAATNNYFHLWFFVRH